MTPEPPRRPFEYDFEADRYVVTVPEDESPTTEVVLAVAELADIDPTDMEPVYRIFDPDAFDAMYETYRDAGTDTDGRITTVIEEHRVTIERGGRIVIEPQK